MNPLVFVLLLMAMWLGGMWFGYLVYRAKLYAPNGQCRICEHAKAQVVDHEHGYVWERHYPTCPIGRLGA